MTVVTHSHSLDFNLDLGYSLHSCLQLHVLTELNSKCCRWFFYLFVSLHLLYVSKPPPSVLKSFGECLHVCFFRANKNSMAFSVPLQQLQRDISEPHLSQSDQPQNGHSIASSFLPSIFHVSTCCQLGLFVTGRSETPIEPYLHTEMKTPPPPPRKKLYACSSPMIPKFSLERLPLYY